MLLLRRRRRRRLDGDEAELAVRRREGEAVPSGQRTRTDRGRDAAPATAWSRICFDAVVARRGRSQSKERRARTSPEATVVSISDNQSTN
uniref:Uncharacterized protein n=1 Tax=Leersia perrieri TaxID=77586 RepID=A0A0D9WI36_9ORYZ